MGITKAQTTVAAQVAGGDQTITTADLGGLTPVAVWIDVVNATVDGTPSDHAIFGQGAATSVGEQFTHCMRVEHGQNPTSTGFRGTTDECVMILDTGANTVEAEATFKNWEVNGVTITWGNAPAAGYLMTFTFFAGTDLTAKADVFSMHAVINNTVDVNTVGFEPDVLLTIFNERGFDDAGYTWALGSHGVVTNNGAVEQFCWGLLSSDSVGAGAPNASISDVYGAVSTNVGGAPLVGADFSTFDAAGFSCTTRLAGCALGEAIGFLALAFAGAIDFEAGIIDTPVAGGNHTWNDPGFEPQHVRIGITQMPAINTGYADANAGSLGVSQVDDDDEQCNSFQDEDASTPSDTQSLGSSQAVDFPDDDGTAAHAATFVAFVANGWTYNFTATEGTAVKWWFVAFETETPAPYVPSVLTPASPRPVFRRPQYELWFTNDYGERLSGVGEHAPLANALWFNASRVVNKIGWVDVGVPARSFPRELLIPDYMIQVWRAPQGGVLSLWRSYLLRAWEFETTDRETLVLSGPCQMDLLRRRIVAAFSGTAQASKDDYADDMMKEVVTESIADGIAPLPAAGTRVWPDLSVAAGVSGGPSVAKSMAFEQLLTPSGNGVLPGIAKTAHEAGTDVFFDVEVAEVSAGGIQFSFNTFIDQPGQDLTGQGMTFDMALRNLRDLRYRLDHSDEVNYVYSAGRGQQANRNVQQAYDEDRYGVSQWGRCEGLSDARDTDSDTENLARGRAVLEAGRPIRTFTIRPQDTGKLKYGEHWHLGDKVLGRYGEEEFEAIVEWVNLVVNTRTGETINSGLKWTGALFS